MYPKCAQVLHTLFLESSPVLSLEEVLMFDTLFLYLIIFVFVTMGLSTFLPRLKGTK